jgi:hypothetical protein
MREIIAMQKDPSTYTLDAGRYVDCVCRHSLRNSIALNLSVLWLRWAFSVPGVDNVLVPASTGEHLFHREDLLDVSRRDADSCRRADICGVVYEMVLTNVVDISEQGAPVTGVSDDQYLGFVGIPKPPVRSLPAPCVHFVFFLLSPVLLTCFVACNSPATCRPLARRRTPGPISSRT